MSDEDVLVDGRPLSSLKVAELKEELESRNLPTKGVKAVLQERLKEALTGVGGPVVARNRTESEASGVDTPQSEASPTKKSETSSPTKRTPRKSTRNSYVEPEKVNEPEAVPEVVEPVKQEEPVAEQEESAQVSEEPSKSESSELPVEKEEPVVEKEMEEEEVTPVEDVAVPALAEESPKVEEPKPVESIQEQPEVKEEVIEKPIEKQIDKGDDSDELDYGDDEEQKEQKEEEEEEEESMEADEPEKSKEDVEKAQTELKKDEKDDGVKKEEKVRGSVSNRRASSPSSRFRHPASSIVHIRGLTRPFTERMLRNEIEKHGGEIVDFWIDKVKSHCFAKLNTEEGADNVMKAMHDKVWPDGNPKKLAIVFDTEDNFTRYKEGRGEIKLPEVVTIGTLTGASRADRLSSTSQTSVLGGKASLQMTIQNIVRDNDKLDLERKEKRGSLASRLTRVDDKEKGKGAEEEKEDRKRGRSETPPFSRGAGFMDEKKAKREEGEKERNSKRDESRREDRHREEIVVVEEEPVLKTPDQLFKKTSAIPAIYYMPLTEEQVAAKLAKKQQPAASAKKEEKAPERAERSARTERDRGDRAERTGGDRDRERDRDHGRDRDRDRSRR